MSDCDDRKNVKHHHKGKSSESLLDKQMILEALNIQPGQTVLDAGCGDGYMAKEFANLVTESGRVYALDPDIAAIDELKRETQGTNIEPVVGDITTTTELESHSIDLIYLSTVFHGFSKDQIGGFVAEVQHLLKPKGTLAILEIKKEETPFGPPMEIRFSPAELDQTIPLPSRGVVEVGEPFYMQIFENEV